MIDARDRVVNAVIINEGRRILLVCKRNQKSGELVWILPGGKVQEGEDDCLCLKRELAEELGITFFQTQGYWGDVIYGRTHFSQKPIEVKLYLVGEVQEPFQVGHEIVRYCWASFGEMMDNERTLLATNEEISTPVSDITYSMMNVLCAKGYIV